VAVSLDPVINRPLLVCFDHSWPNLRSAAALFLIARPTLGRLPNSDAYSLYEALARFMFDYNDAVRFRAQAEGSREQAAKAIREAAARAEEWLKLATSADDAQM
jgi:hypothetical protein